VVLALLAVGLYLIISRTAQDSVDALAGAGAPLDETRRQRTLADMRAIRDAIRLMQADTGAPPSSFAALEAGGYLASVPANDGWGNPFVYVAGRTEYEITSLGSDGRAGPAAPQPWISGSYACDLVLHNGEFTQAPSGR
jgi:hypothetical protein